MSSGDDQAPGEVDDGEAAGDSGGGRRVGSATVMVINFGTALPYVYAHWRRSLAVVMAETLRGDEVQRLQGLVSRRLHGEAERAPGELFRTVACPACSLTFHVAELSSVSSCPGPECGADVVAAEMERVKAIVAEQLRAAASGDQLTANRVAGGEARNRSWLNARANSALLRDQRTWKQALAMEALYASQFVVLHSTGVVADAEDVLLAEEFEVRSRGKSAASLQFRYHRDMRVRLVEADAAESAKIERNERHMAVRAVLPPWFQVATLPTSRTQSAHDDKPNGAGGGRTKKPRREETAGAKEPLAQLAEHVAGLHYAEFVNVPLLRKQS
jgi:hypothetical protein